jgi:hypothetical protein
VKPQEAQKTVHSLILSSDLTIVLFVPFCGTTAFAAL